MVIEKLHTIFDFDDSKFCQKNELYDFEIHLINPVSKDFQLIVTKGLVNYTQPVKEKFEQFQHIELYMCLPDYWDLSKSKWPLEWLNKIAAVPEKNKTWFGPGDTIPAGNPPKIVDEKLKTDHFILSEPILLSGELSGEKWNDSSFNMLAVIPIFKKEFDFKMQFSATKLFERFATKNVTELIDIYREPVGRRKFMGLI